MINQDNTPYLELITSEHKLKPKYNAYTLYFLDAISGGVKTEETPIGEVSGAGNILTNINTLFDLENASGAQLDALGTIIGLDRNLPVNDPRIELPLDDESYRFCLIAKIYKNNWDGTTQGIYDIMQTLFPDNPWELVDNQNMTITVNLIQSGITEQQKALFEYGYIIPKPSGVSLSINIQDAASFGWDRDTDFIKGWDTGIWTNN